MNKNELRTKYKLIRKQIPSKEDASFIIVNKIMNLEEYNNANVIALYSALSSEVNVNALIIDALNNGKIVCLPRVIDESKMEFVQIEKIEDLNSISDFNILEPTKGKVILKEEIDLMVVPGICFDRNGYRIGYGKGYYDYYLNKDIDIFKVGVCFKQCLIENIEHDQFDRKMNLVITD